MGSYNSYELSTNVLLKLCSSTKGSLRHKGYSTCYIVLQDLYLSLSAIFSTRSD